MLIVIIFEKEKMTKTAKSNLPDARIKIVYFEVNSWCPGDNYPAVEPFLSWMSFDSCIPFGDIDWVRENKLCVVENLIDMSINFCVTATEEWVKENCPELLTTYTQFLRYPEKNGCVHGEWGDEFLEYSEENIGIKDDYQEVITNGEKQNS